MAILRSRTPHHAGTLAPAIVSVRNLLSRPAHRKRSDRGSAAGSEGVWGREGRRKDEIRSKKDVRGAPRATGKEISGRSAVAMKWMRSWGCVGAWPSRPLGQDLFFGSVIFWGGALRGVSRDQGRGWCRLRGDLDRLAGGGTLVEQVEARLRIVVWNPFADGLPRRFDGLEGLDVERRVGWWRDVDDRFPKSVEAEEELDFAGADDGAGALHGGLAAGALERVGAPDAHDEVAPERTHGASGDFGWWRDDGWLGCGRFFVGGFLQRRAAGHAAAFVRVKTVIADRLLAARRDVVDGGGEEVGGGEDFKVALRAPTAARTVDDGLRFWVPVDFLEGEWGAQEIFGETLTAFGVAGGDGLFPAVEVEAAVFPGERRK